MAASSLLIVVFSAQSGAKTYKRNRLPEDSPGNVREKSHVQQVKTGKKLSWSQNPVSLGPALGKINLKADFPLNLKKLFQNLIFWNSFNYKILRFS
ncbi:MAG: hypothetical protein LBE13_05375 [Bacteroidales bacterium]|nr:hypothetical protein [Bacteroidales bacterium]